jgi:hypothetical protein
MPASKNLHNIGRRPGRWESVRLRRAEIMSEIEAALDRARAELTELKPR